MRQDLLTNDLVQFLSVVQNQGIDLSIRRLIRYTLILLKRQRRIMRTMINHLPVERRGVAEL